MQMMRPRQKPPSEFEKVSQIQTQQKAAEAQMNYENRLRELELKYQKMILDFETRAKEVELKYSADIDEKAIRRASLEQKGLSDTNKQMLDAATKNILKQEQPVSSTTIAIDVEPE
jgi:hypothetical protein